MKLDEKIKEAIVTLDNYCRQYDDSCIDKEGKHCPLDEVTPIGQPHHCYLLLRRVPERWREEILELEEAKE